MTEADMCLRLVAAAGFGVAIGLEREFANKPAGLRTHVIVCVAAALLTTSSFLIGEQLNVPGESLRVAAGVVTGIGFIGAGTILQTRSGVVGLTTAATLFMAAALGIAVGGGFYYVALTAAGLTVLSTWVLRVVDPALGDHAEGAAPEEEPRRRKLQQPAAARKTADPPR
jgi:putative Mg2+ transporter-C (MgtC) family protein